MLFIRWLLILALFINAIPVSNARAAFSSLRPASLGIFTCVALATRPLDVGMPHPPAKAAYHRMRAILGAWPILGIPLMSPGSRGILHELFHWIFLSPDFRITEINIYWGHNRLESVFDFLHKAITSPWWFFYNPGNGEINSMFRAVTIDIMRRAQIMTMAGSVGMGILSLSMIYFATVRLAHWRRSLPGRSISASSYWTWVAVYSSVVGFAMMPWIQELHYAFATTPGRDWWKATVSWLAYREQISLFDVDVLFFPPKQAPRGVSATHRQNLLEQVESARFIVGLFYPVMTSGAVAFMGLLQMAWSRWTQRRRTLGDWGADWFKTLTSWPFVLLIGGFLLMPALLGFSSSEVRLHLMLNWGPSFVSVGIAFYFMAGFWLESKIASPRTGDGFKLLQFSRYLKRNA